MIELTPRTAPIKEPTMKTEPRYYVHTVTSGVGNKIRTPHWVMDRTTNLAVDEFVSKNAAQTEARDLNEGTLAPATDAYGNDCWNLWATRPGRIHSVGVTTDSFANRSAIGNFLLDEGYNVETDGLPTHPSTPGVYEVKVYGKMKRVTIVGIKSQTYRAYSGSRDMTGYYRTAKFAVDDKDTSHTFQNVKRPWAEAAPDHEQAQDASARRDNALEALKDVLPSASVGKGYSLRNFKDNGRIDIRLTVDEAEALVRRLS